MILPQNIFKRPRETTYDCPESQNETFCFTSYNCIHHQGGVGVDRRLA